MKLSPALLASQARKTGRPVAGAGRAAVADPVKRRGRMNGTETAYAAHLELRRVCGDVRWYGFEAIKLRLADGAWYCPDFLVVLSDGRHELHECKGFWREAARLRIKIAADRFPFYRVAAVKREGKSGWKYEEF